MCKSIMQIVYVSVKGVRPKAFGDAPIFTLRLDICTGFLWHWHVCDNDYALLFMSLGRLLLPY